MVFLFMYFNFSNYVDPHMIITIFHKFWLYFIFFFTNGFGVSVFDPHH
jgi:hypothetical protein